MSPTSYHCSTPRWGESGGGSGNDLLSQRQAASIVGAGALHDRVREGNGWVHSALGHQCGSDHLEPLKRHHDDRARDGWTKKKASTD